MTEPHTPAVPKRLLSRRSLGAAVFLVVLTVGVVVAALGLRGELDELRSSSRDNVEWSVSQLDVDVLSLKLAIRDTRLGTGSLQDLRKRYDIFYSRVRTIGSGTGFAELREVASINTRLSRLEEFLVEITPLIDLPDGELWGRIDHIDARLTALREDVRALSTDGVQLFAQSRVHRRDKFVDALFISMMVGLGLVLLLGFSLVILERQRRLAQQRANETASGLLR